MTLSGPGGNADFSSARGAADGTSATESHARAGTKLTACTIDAKEDGLENVSFYHFTAEPWVRCPGLAVEQQEVSRMALLRIYDVGQEPPALIKQQEFPFASDAITIADELAKRKPERLYRVFDADMNVVYAR